MVENGKGGRFMSKTELTQFKLFFDLGKELEYIKEMNRLGWKLERVRLGCFYDYKRCDTEEYVTLLYAESQGGVQDTLERAGQNGYEAVPHKLDGMGTTLYLTGKQAEVSQDFAPDGESALRACRAAFKRQLALSILCAIITAAIFAEVCALFIVPALTSGSAVFNYPVFFALTIAFSVLAVVFLIITLLIIKSAVKMKNKLSHPEAENGTDNV